MDKKNNNKQVAKIATFITSIFVIFLSISYAFINQTLMGTKRQVIVAGNLQLELKEGNEITLENMLPMYDEVGMLQKPFEFQLHNKVDTDINYTLKLLDITPNGVEKLDTKSTRYGFIKDEEQPIIDSLSNLKANILDKGTIQGNKTINCSLRFWIDSWVEDESWINNQTLSYKISVETFQSIKPKSVGDIVLDGVDLGKNCEVYNDGVDTFLVGNCSQNYIWYSGKLWRAVLKNNDTGAVKVITDNPMTSIAYNEENNSAFENSYADQWLNQEFLPTLHNYEDYLITDSAWDATLNSSNEPTRPTYQTTVNRTVGLLNSYELYTNSIKTIEITGRVDGIIQDERVWSMTPWNESMVSFINIANPLMGINTIKKFGIRPVVNLKQNVKIVDGTGTIDDPFRLEGDRQDVTNGSTLISTRYSGEYIKFNNELYRIVGVENDLTKITSVYKPTELENKRFNSSGNVGKFIESDIRNDLENYYQRLDSLFKGMIEPNTTWYLGTVMNNYKSAICMTPDIVTDTRNCQKTDSIITANIALPRVGEIFTAPMARDGSSDYFFTLTPSLEKTYHVWYDAECHDGAEPTSLIGARPSMYLRANVVISKDNTGDGTYEHPYDIELG